jgi:hypothetical protein
MREKRVSRAVGKLESSPLGAKTSTITAMSTKKNNPGWNVEGIGLEEGEATGEMMQMFEEENREMLKGFEGMMEGVRYDSQSSAIAFL